MICMILEVVDDEWFLKKQRKLKKILGRIFNNVIIAKR